MRRQRASRQEYAPKRQTSFLCSSSRKASASSSSFCSGFVRRRSRQRRKQRAKSRQRCKPKSKAYGLLKTKASRKQKLPASAQGLRDVRRRSRPAVTSVSGGCAGDNDVHARARSSRVPGPPYKHRSKIKIELSDKGSVWCQSFRFTCSSAYRVECRAVAIAERVDSSSFSVCDAECCAGPERFSLSPVPDQTAHSAL